MHTVPASMQPDQRIDSNPCCALCSVPIGLRIESGLKSADHRSPLATPIPDIGSCRKAYPPRLSSDDR